MFKVRSDLLTDPFRRIQAEAACGREGMGVTVLKRAAEKGTQQLHGENMTLAS